MNHISIGYRTLFIYLTGAWINYFDLPPGIVRNARYHIFGTVAVPPVVMYIRE